MTKGKSQSRKFEKSKVEMKNKSVSKKSDIRSTVYDRGFTLLEILVAMGILMLIVLMMATLFHASTTAWTNGLRQTEMSIQARSVISLIQRDVSQAVGDGASARFLLECEFRDNKIEVCTPVVGETTNRTFRRVKYECLSPGANGVITRREDVISTANSGYGSPAGGTERDLIGNVDTFEVTVFGGDPSAYTTNLPAWVGIKLTLLQTAESGTGFKVSSLGRNGVVDTLGDPDDDDVRTWREE